MPELLPTTGTPPLYAPSLSAACTTLPGGECAPNCASCRWSPCAVGCPVCTTGADCCTSVPLLSAEAKRALLDLNAAQMRPANLCTSVCMPALCLHCFLTTKTTAWVSFLLLKPLCSQLPSGISDCMLHCSTPAAAF